MDLSQHPSPTRLIGAVDATWPAAETRTVGGWTLRRGEGGGQRVSAASGHGEIGAAVHAMRTWGQPPLFRVGPDDTATDNALEQAGYVVHDQTVLYAAKAEALVGDTSHTAAAYRCQFRPAIMEEIWQKGGIGPARLAVMDRASGASCFLMSRAGDRPAGVAFLALDQEVAMIHAIEVLPEFRRQGAGVLLMELAARMAGELGAEWLALAVTAANGPARALYDRMGMRPVGQYHYRRLPGEGS
ncbi:MAG: GNAT family N-acetyltransferase [Pseudomonadota bacterium]